MKNVKLGSRLLQYKGLSLGDTHIQALKRIEQSPTAIVVGLSGDVLALKCLKKVLIVKSGQTVGLQQLGYYPFLKTSVIVPVSIDQYDRLHHLFMKSETRGDFEKKFNEYARTQNWMAA
ncbi:hypothetical protein [Phaeocystidibacter marisrubri]|uniref:Uncharacterized protein n=1 Tax=Phaeocystidibacter marisrubri TaxID=1577780 RepID=A0A6L3ZD85_9FLAO|nr:hypothetical protein [Phaeocystidibacter marisrubri]KAB2815508.1 hypothetical protein F8C82_07320 [Phaeocystidibacter marisrubri]GGH64257.1 hypothetical protein GCM10011318_00100 [Phaeocystidibacter marisrubri]